MATRLQGGFRSDQNAEFDIYIDEDGHTGSITTFKVAGDGFVVNYPAQSQNTPRKTYILPSSVNFTLKNQNSGHDALRTLLLAAAEEKFKVRIDKGGSLFWNGLILNDNLNDADQSKPSDFAINATDGLGRLKDIDYNDNGVAYEGRQTVFQHVFNCLDKAPFGYFYGADDEFLKISCNWYEDQHAVTATLDPFQVTDFDHSVFVKLNSAGKTTYKSCYDVLYQCLQIMGCRMYYSDGVWRIEQINIRKDATFTEFIYKKDGALHSTNTSASYEQTVNNATSKIRPLRLAGGNTGYYPQLDKVCLEYKHDSGENILENQDWGQTDTVDENKVGSIDSVNNTDTFILSGKINYASSWLDTNNLQYYRLLFNMRIRVGSYYLRRTVDLSSSAALYGVTEWTTEESDYQIVSNLLFTDPGTSNTITLEGSLSAPFTAPEFPGTGDLYFDIYYGGSYAQDGSLIRRPRQTTTLVVNWHFVDAELRLLNEGDQAKMERSRIYCAKNIETTNTEKVDLESLIGDGPFLISTSKLKVYDGSEWQTSNDWRIADTGAAYNIQDLVVREILAGQTKAIKRYEGSITGDFYAHTRLEWDSEYYIFEGGTFNANSDTWQGRWFNISIDTTLVETDPPEPQDDDGGLLEVGIATAEGLPPGLLPATTATEVQANETLSTVINAGYIDALELTTPITTFYASGDTITLIDPQNGISDTVTVAAATQIGDTLIPIEGYVENSYPGGAVVVPAAVDTVPDAQLTGEIINDFFEAGTIEDESYYFKTEITPEIVHMAAAGRTASLSTGVMEYFYTIAPALDGTQVKKIYTATATAGSGGNTTIEYKKNGTVFHTATLGSTVKATDDTLSAPEPFATGDDITIDVTAVSTTAPQGLNIYAEFSDREILLKKITYQLNRIDSDDMVVRNTMNYSPAAPIGYGSIKLDNNSHIDCGDDSSLDLNDSLTIMAWVKFDDLSSTMVIAGKYTALIGYHIYSVGSLIIFQVDNQTACRFSTSSMNPRKWYHITGVYNKETARIYLDGVLMDTATYSAPSSVAAKFFIGANDIGNGANFLDGSVAMVRLFNKGLTQTEILEQRETPYNRLTARLRAGLISSWELNTISDSTTVLDNHRSNDGTIIE